MGPLPWQSVELGRREVFPLKRFGRSLQRGKNIVILQTRTLRLQVKLKIIIHGSFPITTRQPCYGKDFVVNIDLNSNKTGAFCANHNSFSFSVKLKRSWFRRKIPAICQEREVFTGKRDISQLPELTIWIKSPLCVLALSSIS